MRRLPGVSVVDVPQASGDALPRMDVPVFVGFAESGPLHRPVLLEDAAQFGTVFGGTLELVTTTDGTVCQAHLRAAVSTFFAGGGQRCYVIRVAGPAIASARLEVPGVALAWRRKSGGNWSMLPAAIKLRAASPGSWSDRAELSARVRSTALRVTDKVAPGDVLRVRNFRVDAWRGYLRVAKQGDVASAIAAAAGTNAVLWMDTSTSPPTSGSPYWHRPSLELVECLTVDLAARQPTLVGAVQGSRRWQRDACALARDAAGFLPWFQADATERLDAGLALSDVGLGEAGWPWVGMPVSEIDSDEPFAVGETEWMIVPYALSASFETWNLVDSGAGDALERNGLANFSASLFLDPSSTDAGSGPALLRWADQVRYFDAPTRRLQGLHAALGFNADQLHAQQGNGDVSEATWLVVPDAVHVGWRSVPAPAIADGTLTLSPDEPCTCPKPPFQACVEPPRPPAAPRLGMPSILPADSEFLVLLRADAATPSDPTSGATRVEVQLAASADFSDERPLPLERVRGAEPPGALDPTPAWALPVPYDLRVTLPAGAYFVRARAWREGLASGWSTPSTLVVRGGTRELLPAPRADADSAVFQVHAALIDLASATREQFALLSVPNAWDERALAAHVELLRQRLRDRQDGTHAASFAAIHHPWLQQRGADGVIYDHPPEGALLAQYARRTRSKGSWAAPGLDPLVSTSGVSAALDPGLLESAGCNALEPRPFGVSATRAATLDTDVDWSSIGVRRLFILLRKVVRREGDRYAFEPNDAALRRSLKLSFDELLRGLLQRGAFRGSRASDAYDLRTASAERLQQEIERGQCSLEISVAPSFPLRFLTLYAVRSGDQWQVQEGS